MQSDYNPVEEPSWLADSIDLGAYQRQQGSQQPDEERHSFNMMSHDESTNESTDNAHHPTTNTASQHNPDPDHNEVASTSLVKQLCNFPPGALLSHVISGRPDYNVKCCQKPAVIVIVWRHPPARRAQQQRLLMAMGRALVSWLATCGIPSATLTGPVIGSVQYMTAK